MPTLKVRFLPSRSTRTRNRRTAVDPSISECHTTRPCLCGGVQTAKTGTDELTNYVMNSFYVSLYPHPQHIRPDCRDTRADLYLLASYYYYTNILRVHRYFANKIFDVGSMHL